MPAEQMRRMMDELQSIEAGTARPDKGPLRKAGIAAVAAAGLMGAPGQAAAQPRQGTPVNYDRYNRHVPAGETIERLHQYAKDAYGTPP